MIERKIKENGYELCVLKETIERDMEKIVERCNPFYKCNPFNRGKQNGEKINRRG